MAVKEGYEAGPPSAEATPLLPVQVSTAEADMSQEQQRSWHGHLFNPFGKCDSTSFWTCFITHYCPAISFGATQRRAGHTTFLRAFLIFFTLVILSVFQRSLWISLSANECLADVPPPDYFGGLRRLGPAFGHPDGALSMTDLHARAAKPFGRPINSGKVDSELCHRLVHTSVWLNFATILYTAYLIVLGARLRTAMRERFGIEGSRSKDFFAWLCCMPCAMCQEARTLAANNVEYGVWHGPADRLPIYSAAAETDVPPVAVMSADAVKPLKA